MKKKLLTGLLLSISVLIGTIKADIPQKTSFGRLKAGFEKTIKERNNKISFINKLGRAFGFQIKSKYDWQDNKGKTFWLIKNETNYFIKAKSDTHSNLVIAPGRIGYLYRNKDWNVTIELEKEFQPGPGSNKKIKNYKNKISTEKNKEHKIEVYLQYKITKKKTSGRKMSIKRTESLTLKAI